MTNASRVLLAVACIGIGTSASAQTEREIRSTSPDTVAELFLIRTALAEAGRRIPRAPGDTVPRVFLLRFLGTDTLYWNRYSAMLYRELHARPMTAADQFAHVLGGTRLFERSDTLFGAFQIGERKRCTNSVELTGSLSLFQMQARKVAGGWELISIRNTGVADSRRCPVR